MLRLWQAARLTLLSYPLSPGALSPGAAHGIDIDVRFEAEKCREMRGIGLLPTSQTEGDEVAAEVSFERDLGREAAA